MKYVKLLALAAALLLPQTASSAPPGPDRFVVVGSNGTLIRSSGGFTVSQLKSGQYLIESTSQINQCAYMATAGNAQPFPATATITGAVGERTAVTVTTYDETGVRADANFHLIVKCSNAAPAGFATVNADGTLARGPFVTNVNHINTGAYYVTFSNSAFSTTCAYTASIGLSGTNGVSDPGFANVAPVSGGTIAILTYDTKGVATDRGFHIYAACNL